MAFPDQVIIASWIRASGGVGGRIAYCECRRKSHDHSIPCDRKLYLANRGRLKCPGCWEANHRTRVASGGKDTVSNCEILCWDCHRATF